MELDTKLKHVNVHQLWLRQEVEAGRAHVNWVPTAQMPADGLTKILPPQKHESFVVQLGLVGLTPNQLIKQHINLASPNCYHSNLSNFSISV
jgi:hypothetical protein